MTTLLAFYSQEQQLAIVSTVDNRGDTLLHKAAMYNRALDVLLAIYSPEKRLKAVRVTNRLGYNVISLAAWYDKQLETLLHHLPVNDRLVAIQEVDKEGNTLLHRIINHHESLKMVLALYSSDSDRFSAVCIKNIRNYSILEHSVIKKRNPSDIENDSPSSLTVLLESLSKPWQVKAINHLIDSQALKCSLLPTFFSTPRVNKVSFMKYLLAIFQQTPFLALFKECQQAFNCRLDETPAQPRLTLK